MGKHYEAFRKLMKHRGVAEALMRERLPRNIAKRITGKPTLLSESFIETSMKNAFADAVLRVPLKGEDACVFCVVEHQRTEERFVLVQLLRYMTSLYAWLATHERESLPLVIPLIIYNGASPWLSEHPGLKRGLLSLKAAATPASELIPAIEAQLATLKDDPPASQFFLNYLKDVLPEDRLGGLVNVVTKYNEEGDPPVRTIRQHLDSLARRRGDRLAVKLANKMAARLATEMATKLAIERADERARPRIRKAATQARTTTLRDNVRRLVSSRFKKPKSDLDERLAGADAATLEKWFDAALSAKSARAVFASH
ncbi:MAG: Rpn family recombination-promoting nuclease/putative transposase [Archangium sp.]